MKKFFILMFILLGLTFCQYSIAQKLLLGADHIYQLYPFIKNKKVALVVNQTSTLTNGTHLLDMLCSLDVSVTKVFAPEHGFRGNADAGEEIIDGKDTKTGIKVISLYGKNFKPAAKDLADTDVVIFDIQDVGVRFYTYISTMHYVMEACAENNKEFVILDRPNPNDCVDGPVLDLKYTSFVGLHPVPVLHGLTVGELGQMINGEGWLKGGAKCKLRVIPMTGWKHGQDYSVPVKPSPNLPNDQAIRLYPSLCFFEATDVSVGRGTEYPFQEIGAPNPKYGSFTFTPRSTEGAKDPLQKDKLCYGVNLQKQTVKKGIDLKFLISFYKKSGEKEAFFINPRFMDLLSGSDSLRLQIVRGQSEESIRKSWEEPLKKYKIIRKKYLLYDDNISH